VWLLFNAIVTLLLGCLILFHWSSSSVWAIGTLVGINLLMADVWPGSARTGDPSGGVKQLSVLSYESVSGPGFGILGRRSVPSRGLETQKRKTETKNCLTACA